MLLLLGVRNVFTLECRHDSSALCALIELKAKLKEDMRFFLRGR